METLVQPVILLAALFVKIQLTVNNVMMEMQPSLTVNANVVDIMKNQVQTEAAKIVTYLDVLHAKKWTVAYILLIVSLALMQEPIFKMVLVIAPQDYT